MKTIKQRIGAVAAAALMFVMTPSAVLDKTVTAVDDTEGGRYSMSGYNDKYRL